MVDWKKHIESDPKILCGKPKIKGTRISVDLILEKLANAYTLDDLLDAYPSISREAVYACLAFASEAIKNEIVYSKAS